MIFLANSQKKEIEKISKEYNIPHEQKKILLEICKTTNCNNFSSILKNSNEIYALFKKAFEIIKRNNFSDEKINTFFSLLYKIETIAVLQKKIISTKFLKLGTVVFLVAKSGEQFPLNVAKVSQENFYLEMPEFLYNDKNRPKTLEKQHFTFKNNTGISFNFVSRIIRYETNEENHFFMIVAHTDKIYSTVQRHFKREFYSEEVDFSPVQINKESKKSSDLYIYSDKIYKGLLKNISAGGCCIESNLPIKENQYLNVNLKKLGIEEKVVGLIKNTRKLENENFALHIQFIKISVKAKNKLYALVYKYEL